MSVVQRYGVGQPSAELDDELRVLKAGLRVEAAPTWKARAVELLVLGVGLMLGGVVGAWGGASVASGWLGPGKGVQALESLGLTIGVGLCAMVVGALLAGGACYTGLWLAHRSRRRNASGK